MLTCGPVLRRAGTCVQLRGVEESTVASLKSLDAGGGTVGGIQRTSSFKMKFMKLSQEIDETKFIEFRFRITYYHFDRRIHVLVLFDIFDETALQLLLIQWLLKFWARSNER